MWFKLSIEQSNPEIYINEIDITNLTDQKVELYNNSTEAQDISGWTLYARYDNFFVFPAGASIAKRSFVIVYWDKDGSSFANEYYTGDTINTKDLDRFNDDLALYKNDNMTKATDLIHFARWKTNISSTNAEDSLTFAVNRNYWGMDEFIDPPSYGYSIQYDGEGYTVNDWSINFIPSIGKKNINNFID